MQGTNQGNQNSSRFIVSTAGTSNSVDLSHNSPVSTTAFDLLVAEFEYFASGASNNVRLYHNNSLAAQGTLNGSLFSSSTASFEVGRHNADNNTRLNGDLAFALFLVGRVLTSAERLALWNGGEVVWKSYFGVGDLSDLPLSAFAFAGFGNHLQLGTDLSDHGRHLSSAGTLATTDGILGSDLYRRRQLT